MTRLQLARQDFAIKPELEYTKFEVELIKRVRQSISEEEACVNEIKRRDARTLEGLLNFELGLQITVMERRQEIRRIYNFFQACIVVQDVLHLSETEHAQ
jgi:hypothetical protein